MAIRIVEDVGAPLVVSGVDILTKEVAPDWNPWATYAMAGLGYLGGFLDYGGAVVKNIGIAALPLAIGNIYEAIKSPVAKRAKSGVTFRPTVINRPIQQTTFPGYEEARIS